MNNIGVLYSSKYGNTKRYAEAIGKVLNITPVNIENIKEEELMPLDTIIYGSSLYAGAIEKASMFEAFTDKNLVVFTVGLASEATTDFQPLLDQNFTKGAQENIKFFHLRVDLNYKTLSVKHRLMMWFLINVILRKKDLILEEEYSVLKGSYGQSLEFYDEKSIEPIIEYVKSINA